MSIRIIIARVFLAFALAFVIWKDDWQAVASLLIVSAAVVAAEYFDRTVATGDSDTANQIKDLQNKVQGLLLAKGMGR
jgi:predicted  nucleic acid-binding Zn ribbon protein